MTLTAEVALLRERVAELETERTAIRKLLPVKAPEGRFPVPEDDAYARGGYYAYAAVADAMGLELPHKWPVPNIESSAPQSSAHPRDLARKNRPASHHLRSSTGMLHLRRSGPEDDGFSYHYARCGWYTDLGRKAVPLAISEDPRVCKRCEVSEP
jgi:hypothetical protein